jgi:hypothetical protein
MRGMSSWKLACMRKPAIKNGSATGSWSAPNVVA